MHTMGADEFMISRAPLFLNRLSLNSYFGYQEVVFHQTVNLEEFDFKMRIQAGGILHVILQKSQTITVYLRLSTRKELPSALVTYDVASASVTESPLPSFPLKNNWQNVRVTVNQSQALIEVDRHPYAEIPWIQNAAYVGFKGDSDLRRLEIDEVALRAPGLNHLESFSPQGSFLKPFLSASVVLLAVGILVSFFSISVAQRALLLLSVVSPLLYCFDKFYWTHLEICALTTPIQIHQRADTHFVQRLENWRYTASEFFWPRRVAITTEEIFSRGYPEYLVDRPIVCTDKCRDFSSREMVFGVAKSYDTKSLRVLFLGSSQTYGEGARTIDTTFFARHHQFLRKAFPQFEITTLNISLPSTTVSEMTDRFEEYYLPFQPDRIYLNMAFNDTPTGYEERLNAVLDRLAKFQVVLVTEPSSDSGFVEMKHAVLRKLARERGIELVDAQSYMEKQNLHLNPLVWWDHVHLTDYGHRIVAERLAQDSNVTAWISKIRRDRSL